MAKAHNSDHIKEWSESCKKDLPQNIYVYDNSTINKIIDNK
jgi:hypothetical protein